MTIQVLLVATSPRTNGMLWQRSRSLKNGLFKKIKLYAHSFGKLEHKSHEISMWGNCLSIKMKKERQHIDTWEDLITLNGIKIYAVKLSRGVSPFKNSPQVQWILT